MDLLQLLILLTITGICGAIAVLALGFSPRGVMILLFSIITGTIGAAVGSWIKGVFRLPDLWALKIGTIRLDIWYTILSSLAVVGLLMGLQWILLRTDQRTTNAQEQSQ
jgi:hypothetical protein